MIGLVLILFVIALMIGLPIIVGMAISVIGPLS